MKVAPASDSPDKSCASGTGIPTVPGTSLTDVVRSNDHVLQELPPRPVPTADEVNTNASVPDILRQHWALFLRNGKEQRYHLRGVLRDEGFARNVLTILFHIPAASSAFALYILLASHLGSVHDGVEDGGFTGAGGAVEEEYAGVVEGVEVDFLAFGVCHEGFEFEVVQDHALSLWLLMWSLRVVMTSRSSLVRGRLRTYWWNWSKVSTGSASRVGGAAAGLSAAGWVLR